MKSIICIRYTTLDVYGPKFSAEKASSNRKPRNESGVEEYNPVEMARDEFEIAANAGWSEMHG